MLPVSKDNSSMSEVSHWFKQCEGMGASIGDDLKESMESKGSVESDGPRGYSASESTVPSDEEMYS